MRRLTILIDMDDTLENLCETWVMFLNERYKTTIQKDEITDWDISRFFPNLSREDIFSPLLEEELWKRVKPLPGAVETVQKLIDEGNKIVVVTASHQDTVSMKLNNVLFKYFPFLSNNDVIVAAQKNLIKGDVLIDDAPHNFAGRNGFGILISAPHNVGFDEKKFGLVRANNWNEVYDAICNYIKEKDGGYYQ